MTKRKKVLIVGARGPVGWNVMEHFTANEPDWDVVGSSRQSPIAATKAEYICVDLTDGDRTKEAFAGLSDVTHLVYTAVLDKPYSAAMGLALDNIQANLRMMENVIGALEAAGAELRQVAFLQGLKAYGLLYGPIKAPAKERDAIHMPPGLYNAQQDYMVERQKGQSWSWTIYRPQIVCGICPGAPTNLISSVAVFCAISRELGLPLRFPGPLQPGLVELVDARLLAAAIAWGANNIDAAANEIFNVTNGDQLDWNNLFVRLAKHFGMDWDRAQTLPLEAMMLDKSPLWDRIVQKHGLVPLSYDDVKGNWGNLDYAFRMGAVNPPPIMSTIKIRQAGFQQCSDSEDMFLDYVREMQALKHIP